ncbi:MAG TPA: DMT family transporter [Anaerolineales bacterium]
MFPGRNQRLKADLILLLVALVWGSAFAAQRVAAANMSSFTFNSLRYLLGALALLPIAMRAKLRLSPLQDRKSWAGTLLVGLVLFGGAAFQQLGLQYTTAGNAGFITGLYVVLVPLVLAVGLRRRPPAVILVASLLAAAGLFLLSTGGRVRFSPGDGLELVGASLWTVHVLLIAWLVKRVDVLQISIAQSLVCGLINLALELLTARTLFAGIGAAWWTVAYTGLFSVALGYTLQAYGQKYAPPADAAILLSGEAVFAALFGWLLLGEALTALQLLGSALMLSGMILAQFSYYT